MSDRHGWGALLPVYNIPETFGNAISYEGQLHWFLENWNEVAEYANDLEQPTVTVGTVATPESNDVPPSVSGVSEGTDLTLNFTLPDKMIKPLGAWSASVAYESLSLVNDGGGNTYISKAPSPAGTPLTNSAIWMQVGVSSANYLPITGGTVTGDMRVNGNTTLDNPLPVASGGSGAATAASAPWLQKSGGTMTGQPVLDAVYAILKCSDISAATGVSSETWGNSRIILRDANGMTIGQVAPELHSDGREGLRLVAQYDTGNGIVENHITLFVDKTGAKSVALDAPSWRTALGLTYAELFTLVTGTLDYTIAANERLNLTVPLDVPTGYRAVALTRITSGVPDVDIVAVGVTNGLVSVRNVSAGNRSGTVTLSVLCLKTG